jgi:hypothetical protein
MLDRINDIIRHSQKQTKQHACQGVAAELYFNMPMVDARLQPPEHEELRVAGTGTLARVKAKRKIH